MIYLQTIGPPTIQVGSRRIFPSATRLFGALLYLIEERGRHIPRTEFQALLFPGKDERSAQHSLRQLLYRLRQVGVRVEATTESLLLPKSSAQTDYELLRDTASLEDDLHTKLVGGILSSFEPSFSIQLARWVDERRSIIQQTLLHRLVAELNPLKEAGRWEDVHSVARAALALDPLNEEGTLALTESLALAGQRANAVQLLDGYLEEISGSAKELRAPALALRNRISERLKRASPYKRVGAGPFVGRRSETSTLWRHFKLAAEGEGRTVVIHGEPGIGKTRLARELLQSAEFDGATTIAVECAPHAFRQPLGVFADLVPRLLAAPGGLGVAPEALDDLHRLTQTRFAEKTPDPDVSPHHLFDRILDAVRDLLESVADENPIAILVDDAHSADIASLNAIYEFTGKGAGVRVMFVLTSRTSLRPETAARGADRIFWLRLRPLPKRASTELLSALTTDTPEDGRPGFDTASLVELAAGNPLYLRWLVAERERLAKSGLPVSLDALLRQRVNRLSDTTLRAFVAAVLLSKHCRLDRLVRIAGMTSRELLAAIQTLEMGGYLVAEGTDFRSAHPMLSQIAMEELTPLTSRLMRAEVAELLESTAAPAQDVAMLWDAAEHWHSVGATDRAVSLLSSCARHCANIGQPGDACDLLSRAISLCDSAPRRDLHLQLIEAARVAENYNLLHATIRRLRVLEGCSLSASIHDDLELMELHALRFSGTPLPDLIPRLQECCASPFASSSHRLEVTSELLAAFDLLLDKDGAAQAYLNAKTIESSTHSDKLTRALIELLYHCLVGTPALAVEAAMNAVQLANATTPETRRCRILANAAAALFRCGACPEGIAAMEKAHAVAQSNGMSPSLVDIVSMLAWMYYVVDDEVNWLRSDHLADTYYKSNQFTGTRTSHYLSNKIEFSIESGDLRAAERWLSQARTEYAEIVTPRSQMLAKAFELRINQLAHPARAANQSLGDLMRMHVDGRSCGLHDNFAEAYWYALDRAEGAEAANRMLIAYVKRYRRDGFPLMRPLVRIALSQGLDRLLEMPPRLLRGGALRRCADGAKPELGSLAAADERKIRPSATHGRTRRRK